MTSTATGKSDILFQNDDGTVAEWQMNGASIQLSANIGKSGTTWQTLGLGSMHFINDTQTTGPIAGTIQSDNFVLTSSLLGSHVITGFDPLHDMITLDQTKFGSFGRCRRPKPP